MDENRDNSPRRREERPSTPTTGRGQNQRTGYRHGSRRQESGRSAARPSRPPQDQRQRAPYVPAAVDYYDLDRDVRARLRTLSKDNAERVGKHLNLAGERLQTNTELAHEQATAAGRRAAAH